MTTSVEQPQIREKRAWLKQLLQPLRGTRRQLFILSMMVNLLALSVPIFVLQVYDRVIFHHGMTTLQGLLLGMVIVLLFELLLRRARTRILQHGGNEINSVLGRSLFEKVVSLPLQQLESKPAAHWQLLFRDIDLVRGRYSGPAAMLLLELPFTLFSIALITIIAAPIAWVLLFIVPLFLLIALRAAALSKKQNREERGHTVQRDQLISQFTAARNGVKSLYLDRYFLDRWSQQQEGWSSSTLQRSSAADRYRDLGQSLSMATTVALTSVGALAILDQQLTLGALIATNMLSSKIITPLVQLTTQWSQFVQFRSARDRLDTLFSMPSGRRESAVAPETVKGVLSFKQLKFGYHEEQELIVDLNGQIGPNGMHVIVGPNGSGKSTLLKLLVGLYSPTSGQIFLDGADIQQYSRADMSRWIGYLPQQITTIESTIRENITCRHPDAEDEAIIEASKLADAYDFVSQLEEGFDTEIGEGGYRFSGGERKRIALASVFLNRPRLFLLDEPTSDLDVEAERALATSLRQLAEEHTVIVVTHSSLLLRMSDSVLMLQQGRIRAAGPTQEMLKQLGVEG